MTFLSRFRSRKEAGRLLRSLANLTNFDLTENDIKELPKLTFSGKVGVINNTLDENKYCNEIKEIQNAGNYVACGLLYERGMIQCDTYIPYLA